MIRYLSIELQERRGRGVDLIEVCKITREIDGLDAQCFAQSRRHMFKVRRKDVIGT